MTCTEWDVALVADKGNILAVWPYCAERKAGLTLLRNPLLTPYLGPYFLLPEYGSEAKRLNKEDKIYKAFWEQLPRWDFFEVQCLPGYNNFLPFHHRGFTHTQRITYRINLTLPTDEIWNGIDAAKKKHIKNAAEELTINEGNADIDAFYNLHKETITGKGGKYPYTKSYFTKLIKTCRTKNAGLLLQAAHTNAATAAILFAVYDADTMYLLLSATDKTALHNGAVSLLIWEAIKRAKDMGLKVFDFEGSMDKGIEVFFRSFGGTRTTYLSCTRNDSALWRLKKAVLG